MSALGLGLSLGHIGAGLRLAVIPRARAMVNIRRAVDPDHAWSATRGLRHRRGRLMRPGRLRRSGSSRRCRCRSRCRRSRRCRSLCLRRLRRFLSLPRSSACIGRKPGLYALMPTTCALLAWSTCIRPILTEPRGSRRRLGHRHLREHEPNRNRHQPNHCLHKRSRNEILCQTAVHSTAKSYAKP